MRNFKISLVVTGSLAMAMAAVVTPARAATYTWDAAPGSSSIEDGPGDWSVGTGNWYDGASYDQFWSDGQDAVFGGGSAGTAGTVAITGTVAPAGLTFNAPFAGSYTLTGGTIISSTANFAVNASGARIESTFTGTAGLTKSGAGTLTIAGPLTCTNTANVRVNGGTLSFATGASGTIGNILNVTGGGAIVIDIGGGNTINSGSGDVYSSVGDQAGDIGSFTLISGTFNQANRFFTFGNRGGGSATYLQTGGTFACTPNSSDYIANYGGTSTMTVSGGLFSSANNGTLVVATRGNGTLTVSGTGIVNVTNIGMAKSVNAAVATVNLDSGGTLTTSQINKVSTQSPTSSATFNFNGGTLKASAGSTVNVPLMGATPSAYGITRANVRNGGAIIDSNSHDVTVSQALVHSNIGGDNAIDGGLTKKSAGTLRLTGQNTYTGNTIVEQGMLSYGSTDGRLDDASTVKIYTDAVMDLNFVGSDDIAELWLGGVKMYGGDYGAGTPVYGSYFTGAGLLRVPITVLLGDTNADDAVDAADFITLKKNFGAGLGGNATVGNFDNTGTVGWNDLSTLMTKMGAGAGAPATTPEPATLGLLAIGALAILRRRRV